MSVVEVETTVTCQCPVSVLWPVLSDTERLNRAVGMTRLRLEPLADQTAARFLVSSRLGGFPVTWEERPFEWVEHRSFQIHRVLRRGPTDWLEFSVHFVPAGQGTSVRLRLATAPKLALLAPFVRLQLGISLRKMAAEVAREDALLAQGDPLSLKPAHPTEGPALARAMADLRQLLSEPSSDLGAELGLELAERLGELVEQGDDMTVSRIRPYVLAEQWELDRRLVLTACLLAVKAGLLELRWEVVCPGCRGTASAVPLLAQLEDHGHCHLCDVAFALDLDQAVEAVFTPAVAIRELDVGPYCAGGPARLPHVVSQRLLPAKGETMVPAPVEPGRYRLFIRGGLSQLLEVSPGASSQVRLEAEKLNDGEVLRVSPDAELSVFTQSDQERHLRVERSSWASMAATAREVTALPRFRREFSSDLLRPGASLRVSRITLLFSDLTGSTRLYSNIGDAAAFALVQDHFELLGQILEQHHGVLVKTMGDAIMAVFTDDMQGLEAALHMLSAFERFRRERPLASQVQLKLGLHAGPCYLFTANGILDYFGQTANVAARLQGLAKGGELVLDEALAAEAVARGRLPEAAILSRYEALVKGVEQPLEVVRVSETAGLWESMQARKVSGGADSLVISDGSSQVAQTTPAIAPAPALAEVTGGDAGEGSHVGLETASPAAQPSVEGAEHATKGDAASPGSISTSVADGSPGLTPAGISRASDGAATLADEQVAPSEAVGVGAAAVAEKAGDPDPLPEVPAPNLNLPSQT